MVDLFIHRTVEEIAARQRLEKQAAEEQAAEEAEPAETSAEPEAVETM